MAEDKGEAKSVVQESEETVGLGNSGGTLEVRVEEADFELAHSECGCACDEGGVVDCGRRADMRCAILPVKALMSDTVPSTQATASI